MFLSGVSCEELKTRLLCPTLGVLYGPVGEPPNLGQPAQFHFNCENGLVRAGVSYMSGLPCDQS